MAGFNPATIPAESEAQGGYGSGNWEQDAVLNYVREFNNAVLSVGPRPDVVSRGRNSLGARETLQLDDRQFEIAQNFFDNEENRGQNLRNFIAQVRRLNDPNQNIITDQNRDQINIFLEILEATRIQENLTFNEPVNNPGADPLGGSGLANERQIRRALDNYYEQQNQTIASRTLNNEEAFTSIIKRQQGILSILTPAILQSGFVNLFYKDIYQIEALDASSFLSLFTNKPSYQDWFQAPSVILSCITPKITIYKQYNTSNGEKFNVEFKFPNKLSGDDIEGIASGTGRGGGYGIKSFSWDYEGQNTFEIDKNIKAKLELYIQDLGKLFPPGASISNTQVSFARRQEGVQEGYIFELFRNVSFSNNNGENTSVDSENSPGGSFIDPYDYRLKIDVAWNFDSQTLANLGPPLSEYGEFFEKAVKTLDLGLEAHDIVFNQDGSIGISLTYRSFLDSVMRNTDFYNILSSGDQRLFRRIEEIRQRSLNGGGNNESNDGGQCEEGETVLGDENNGNPRTININSELFQNLLQSDFNNPDNIIANYSSIFNRLIEESRIYVLGFDYGLIADEVSTENVGAIVDNALSEDADVSREEKESYLRIVQNELSLEAIESSAFNVGRLSEDGVALLTDILTAEQELLADRISDQDDEQVEDISLTFNLDGQTPLSVLNSGDVNSNPYTVEAEATGRYVRTYFTTLGDIIQSVLGFLIESQGPEAREDAPYLISGPYLFKDIRNRNILINLSNILVDIDSFRKFFTEKVISNLRTSYSLEQFIKDMYSNFSYETNARAVAQGSNLISSNSRLFYNVFSKTYSEPREELVLRMGNRAEEDFLSIGPANISAGFKDNDNTIIFPRSFGNIEFGFNRNLQDLNELLSQLKPKIIDVQNFFASSGGFSQADDPQAPSVPRTYNYIYITATPTDLVYEGLSEDYNYSHHKNFDNQRGIYHLTFGERKSIIKNLSFQKFDDPSLRTSRLIGGGADSLNYLRELYNVNLSLIGTPFLMPGQYLYLNPIFMGTDHQARDISEFLGFGGYYSVLNVSNKIDSNHNYTTECKLFFQSSGRPTDQDACFLRNPISLYSEEAVELGNIEIIERTAVEEARDDLRSALDRVDDNSGPTSGNNNEYIFENYYIDAGSLILVEQGKNLLDIFENSLHVSIKVINFKININQTNVNLSTITITDVSFYGDFEIEEANGSVSRGERIFTPVENPVSTYINTFIALNENSSNPSIKELTEEIQAIFNANRALQAALSQQNSSGSL
jgi:hypothetical protein